MVQGLFVRAEKATQAAASKATTDKHAYVHMRRVAVRVFVSGLRLGCARCPAVSINQDRPIQHTEHSALTQSHSDEYKNAFTSPHCVSLTQ